MMFDQASFDLRNVLQGHSLALLLLYIGVLAFVGLLHVAFRGSVVV